MGPPKVPALESVDSRFEEFLGRAAVLTARWKWLLPGLVTGFCVYIAYLLTHPYPAFGAGLYLYMAEHAVAEPLGLPEYIPHYTERGVPFAYPPLMFYVNGLFVTVFGVDPVELARHLPPLASIAALVPFYLLGEELLDSRRQAGLATILLAVAPPVLQWQISAGGIVRGPAFLFVVAGLYTGVRLFRERDPRWLGASVLLFGLTVLTHPTYTAFFGLSYIWMFLNFDRSVRGLGNGAAVAAGGFLLTAPWWITVARTHGIGVFTGAAGTHGGIGQQIIDLFVAAISGNEGATTTQGFGVPPGLVDFTSFGMAVITVWAFLLFVGWLYLLTHENELFLTGWVVVVAALLAKPRFPFAIGALIGGAAYFRLVVPEIEDRLDESQLRAAASAGLTLVVVLAAVGSGVAYAGSQIDAHAGSQSLPQFIDDDDVEAMAWTAENTDEDAEFVVLGDAAEWFPYKTERTMLVGPWGVEWEGQAEYEQHLGWFGNVSTCENETCLTDEMDEIGVAPDYVYVPSDEYTVRGMEDEMPAEMRDSLTDSPDYELVYENDGAMLFAYDGGEADGLLADAAGLAERFEGSTSTEYVEGAISTEYVEGAISTDYVEGAVSTDYVNAERANTAATVALSAIPARVDASAGSNRELRPDRATVEETAAERSERIDHEQVTEVVDQVDSESVTDSIPFGVDSAPEPDENPP